MPTKILNISRSHNTLGWLAQINKGRRVPQKVVQELSALQSMEQAQAFVKSAGLQVMAEIRRSTRSVNSVSVHPPEKLRPFIPTRLEFEYHAPQIMLPRIAFEDIPFGTVLVNFLLPRTGNASTAEAIFREYQAFLSAMMTRLDARPFVCITGNKTGNPLHSLDYRGFRFFFSPDPGPLYARIKTIMEKHIRLDALDMTGAITTESKNLSNAIQELMLCTWSKGKIGHSMLEDIKSYDRETALIDLR